MILFLGLIFLAIIGLEAPRLLWAKRWRELAAFGGFLLIAMVMSFAAVLDIPLPNPSKGIDAVLGPVGEWLDKVLR